MRMIPQQWIPIFAQQIRCFLSQFTSRNLNTSDTFFHAFSFLFCQQVDRRVYVANRRASPQANAQPARFRAISQLSTSPSLVLLLRSSLAITTEMGLKSHTTLPLILSPMRNAAVSVKLHSG